MAMAVLPRFEGSLSHALVHLGLVDANDLAELVDRLARERFLDLFRWTRGSLRFFRGVTPPPTAIALTLDTSEALRQGAALVEDPAEHLAPIMERKLTPRSPLRGIQRSGLGPLGPEVINRSDGRTTVRAMIQALVNERRVSPREVQRELYFLTEIEAVETRA
jgi:hypothetical protein